MRYVLDASVAVAALRSGEPGHADALRRCRPLFAGADEIVVPAHFEVEVASALLRRGVHAGTVDHVIEHVLAARTVVTLGPKAARATRAIVKKTQLRAGDALYVWVSTREGLPLVTADAEIHRRAGAVCQVVSP